MNEKSKECFIELTKICVIYSELTDSDMDKSLNNILLTDTGKSITNNNKITMNMKDKDIIRNILNELIDIKVINKEYSDEEINKVMINYTPNKLDIFKEGDKHCLLN